ncbi:MAG: LytR C-terminal domain-containing protein [Bifidobacteriaceae bacterium]|jgi:hypothetical protein|nr:LytR C-terminal domain-containing protein [Bifidobacteriaceae bacterium]MCI1978500.1 LytR C-terminal domain-containing protein [Bifidobacteriaceae bacterium]
MTTPGSVQSERKARKEFVRDRQRMVITVAVCFLVACVVLATLTILGVFKKEEEKAVVDASTNYGVSAPCIAKDTTAPDYTAITVRVLNGTSKSGLARALGQALANRGFVLQGVSDYQKNDVARTEIRFGEKGLSEAYTLYAQFNDAILRMDNRTDKLVDVIVGETFDDLNDTDQISTTAGTKLTSVGGCVAASKLTDLPAATKHDAVK